MKLHRFIPQPPRRLTTVPTTFAPMPGDAYEDEATVTEVLSSTIAQVYEVATDFWADVEIVAGFTQGAGEVVQLLGRQFTPAQAAQLRSVLDAALVVLQTCKDPACPDHYPTGEAS